MSRWRDQTLRLLRWLLIIVTAYLLLLHRSDGSTSPAVALFVAAYLASNLALPLWVRLIRPRAFLDFAIVLFDTAAVTLALALVPEVGTDLYLLYFLVLLIAALGGSLSFVALSSVIVSTVYLYTLFRSEGGEALWTSGVLIRVPFLFTVALFFGYLVEGVRRARRALDEERDLWRAELLSWLVHDLKAPGATIQSLSELLLAAEFGPLNAGQRDIVLRVHRNAERLVSLTLNLLDMRRIEVGRLALHREPVDLGEVVARAVSATRHTADVKTPTITYRRPSDLPRVEVDPQHMGRVIRNLLQNALQYTPPDGRVSVTLTHAADEVLVAVADTGTGIPADRLPHLFEPFHRSVGGDRNIGSGVGLYIVKVVTEAHGGRVEVDSAAGQGTIFTLHLPCEGKPPLTAPRAA